MIILMGPKILHWNLSNGNYLMIKLRSFYARIKFSTRSKFRQHVDWESDNVKNGFPAHFNWSEDWTFTNLDNPKKSKIIILIKLFKCILKSKKISGRCTNILSENENRSLRFSSVFRLLSVFRFVNWMVCRCTTLNSFNFSTAFSLKVNTLNLKSTFEQN